MTGPNRKTHKYSPALVRHLDNPLRQLLEVSPGKVFKNIQISQAEVWADLGCGSGYFTIPLARLVAKVYAVDISGGMLAILKERAAKERVDNVELVQNTESSIPLTDRCLDGALLGFVAHELYEPEKFFLELAKILKQNGRLYIIEYTKVPSLDGPPLDHRLSPEQVDQWALEAGLTKGRSWKWSHTVVGWEFIKMYSN